MSPQNGKVALVATLVVVGGGAVVNWVFTPYYLADAKAGSRAALLVESRRALRSGGGALLVEVPDPQSCSSGSGTARVLGAWNSHAATFEPRDGEVPCSSLRVLSVPELQAVIHGAGPEASSVVNEVPQRPCVADRNCVSYSLGVARPTVHVKCSKSVIQTRLDSSGNRQGTESICGYELNNGTVHVLYWEERTYAFERWPDL
jgi:hypothetical protein